MNNRLFQFQYFPPIVQLMFFFCIFFIANLLQVGIMSMMNIDLAKSNSQQILTLMALTQVVGFLLPAIVYVKLLPKSFSSFFQFKTIEKKSDIFLLVILTLGTLLLVLGISQLILKLPLGQQADHLQAQRKAMEDTALQMQSLSQVGLRIVVMALLPAICEEVFFRGIVQRFAHTFIKQPILAIMATAIVFSLFHASWYNFLPYTVAGTILGLVYYKTGNIWYNILLHFLVNASQVVMVYLQSNPAEETSLSIIYALGFLVAGAIISYWIINQLAKGKMGRSDQWQIPFVADRYK